MSDFTRPPLFFNHVSRSIATPGFQIKRARQKGVEHLQKWACPEVLNVAVTAKPWLLAEGACRSKVFRIAWRLAAQ